MTQNEKIITGIVVGIIVIAAIVYRKNISDWFSGSSSRIINNTIVQPTPAIVQPIIVPIVPVTPKPVPESCNELLKNINAVKAKLSVTTDPYQKAKLQGILNTFNQQYSKMGCAGGPPPNPNSQV